MSILVPALRRVVLTLAVLGLVIPSTVLADSDPPSDTLVGGDVYYPYSPPVSAGAAKILDKVVADAKKAGYPIRVAIVAGQPDLGAVPDLFGQPQRYARFLQSEITFNAKRPLLVVMPSGWGTIDSGPKAAAIVGALAPPGSSSDVLANSAAVAVARLAGAAGHPIATPSVAAPASGGTSPAGSSKRKSSTPWWVFVVPLLLVAAGVALMTRRLARRPDGDAEAPSSDSK